MNVLDINNISMQIKGKKILDKITFSLQEGTVTGFIGHNGAGKSTTLKIIMGLVTPTSGSVSIFNKKIQDHRIYKKIGYLPENPVYPDYLNIRECLSLMADLYQIDSDLQTDLITRLIDTVGLNGHEKKLIKQYSRGMKQRLGIAQAIINEPDLLILDEPLNGLDPIGREDMLGIIRHLKKEGKTIILSSHLLFDLEKICSRYLMISQGKMIDDIKGLKGDLEQLYLEKTRKEKK